MTDRKYKEVCKRIPDLIATLETIETRHPVQLRIIGEAISLLVLMQDLLEESNE